MRAMKLSAYNRLRKRIAKATGRQLPAAKRGPDKMESRFNLAILGGRGVFEPKHFTITNVNERKYTPDWLYNGPSGIICLIENKPRCTREWKGHASRPRSQLAFEIAAEKYRESVWIWSEPARQPGYWKITAWYRGGDEIRTRVIRSKEEFDDIILEVTRCPNG